MKSISTLYQTYRIIPNLQVHQLRVAAVAKQICESLTQLVDTELVTRACLLHDMGNILKFNFDDFPEFYKPEGRAYWEQVQAEFRQKYGSDEHAATLNIAAEVGVPKQVLDVIDGVGFGKIPAAVANAGVEQKICCYADQRVGPFGVLSIEARLAEGKKRYGHRPDRKMQPQVFDQLADSLRTLEHQIFEQARIQPTEITDLSTAPDILALRNFVL